MCRWRDWPWDGEGPLLEVTGEGEGRIRVGYADPPYLITCAAYNENNGWTERDECDLLKFLDSVHASGIRFALSNVLSSKGKRNTVVIRENYSLRIYAFIKF